MRRTRKWRSALSGAPGSGRIRVERPRDGGGTAARVSGTGRERGGTGHGTGTGPAEVAVGPDWTVPCRPLLTRGVPQAGVWRRGGAAGGDLRAGPRHPGQERPLRRKACGACGGRWTRCRSCGAPVPVPRRPRPGARPGWGSRAGHVPAALGWVLLSRPSAAATLLFLLGVRRGLQPLSPPCPAPKHWEEP